MIAITNGRIVFPDRVDSGLAILVEGNRISDIVSAHAIPASAQVIDAGGRLVTPGLVDIHIHGAEGVSFNDAKRDSFATIAAACARRGITTILATTATATIDELAACLAITRQWEENPGPGAQIAGAHVEGPYFSMEQRGAQDPKHIRNPDDGSVDTLLAFRDVIRMLTFAPELPGAIDLTRRLLNQGIVAAMGHSSAIDTEVEAAVAAGATHAIHLWSGQSSTVRHGAWRKPGILEASLASDFLTGEIIADNKHLPPTLMRLAWKCLGSDRLCLVSDATSGAGLPEGSEFSMGAMSYIVAGGVGMMHDQSAFAGSTTLLNQMVPIAIEHIGVPLHEAVRMASLTPANVVGLEDHIGSIEVGKDADLVIFEDDFTPHQVMIGGAWQRDSTA
jgi:N-acetylglucosamine-6-phosphate deacetylase